VHGNLHDPSGLTAATRPRLTGFGTDEPPDESMSTAGYLAPEQVRGNR
jgi:hypothetical protein